MMGELKFVIKLLGFIVCMGISLVNLAQDELYQDSTMQIRVINVKINGIGKLSEFNSFEVKEGDTVNLELEIKGPGDHFFGYYFNDIINKKSFFGKTFVHYDKGRGLVNMEWQPNQQDADLKIGFFTVYASSDLAPSVSTRFRFDIKNVNFAPKIVDISSELYSKTDEIFHYQPSIINDDHREKLLFELNPVGDHVADYQFDQQTGKLIMEYDPELEGSYTFELKVSEVEEPKNSDSFRFRVNWSEVNQSPKIGLINEWQVLEGRVNKMVLPIEDPNQKDKVVVKLIGTEVRGLTIEEQDADGKIQHILVFDANYDHAKPNINGGKVKYNNIFIEATDLGKLSVAKNIPIVVYDRPDPKMINNRIEQTAAYYSSFERPLDSLRSSIDFVYNRMETLKNQISILGGSLTLVGAGMGTFDNKTGANKISPIVTGFGAFLVLYNEVTKPRNERLKKINEGFIQLDYELKKIVFDIDNIRRMDDSDQANTKTIAKIDQLFDNQALFMANFTRWKTEYQSLISQDKRISRIVNRQTKSNRRFLR